KSILALVAAVALGVGTYAAMSPADPPRQAEGKKEEVKPAREEQDVQWDDPLPAGSTLRFGTTRFRHGVSIGAMAVSADGKTAVVGAGTRSSDSTRAFDLVSGRVLFTLATSEAEAIAYSPDGRTIVIKQALRLHLHESSTGNLLRSIVLPRVNTRGEG